MKTKKNIIALLVIILSAVMAIGFGVGCKKDLSSDTEKMALNKNQLTLLIGQSETLILTGVSEDSEVIWESKNSDIVAVSGGTVTAVSSGYVEVRAKVKEDYVSCFITVVGETGNSGLSITLNSTEASLYWYKGESFNLIPTVYKDEAVVTDIEIQWSNTDNQVATVEEGVVKALKTGETTVKCRVESGNDFAEATCKITVKDCIDIRINDKKEQFNSGEKYTYQITVIKNDEEITSPKISFISEDINVVAFDAEGEMTAVSAGETTVKIAYLTEEKTINVKVKNHINIDSAETFVRNMEYQNSWTEYELCEDIDLTEYFSENPWGEYVFSAFDGHLNGNGYVIKGLNREGRENETASYGLFKTIGAGAIIENVCFDIDYTTYVDYSNIITNNLLGTVRNCYFYVTASVNTGKDTGRCAMFGSMVEGGNYAHSPIGNIGTIENCIVETPELITPFSNYGEGKIKDSVIIQPNAKYIAGYRSGFGNNAKNKALENIYGYTSIEDFINGNGGKKCRIYDEQKTEVVEGVEKISTLEKVEFNDVENGTKVYAEYNGWQIDQAQGTISLCNREINGDSFNPRIEKVRYEAVIRLEETEIKIPKAYTKGKAFSEEEISIKIYNPQGEDITESEEYTNKILTPKSVGEYKVVYTVTTGKGIATRQAPITVLPKVEIKTDELLVIVASESSVKKVSVKVNSETDDKKVSYSVKDESVATVDGFGNVTMKKAGQTVLTITHDLTGITKEVYVYCYEVVKEIRTVSELKEISQADSSVYAELKQDITVKVNDLVSENGNEYLIKSIDCGLNGNGHKITYTNGGTGNFVGLIETVNATALIRNVILEATFTFTKDYNYAVATTNSGLIKDCYFKFSATQTAGSNYQETDPLIRYQKGRLENLIIKDDIKVGAKQRTLPLSTTSTGTYKDIAIITKNTEWGAVGRSNAVNGNAIPYEKLVNVYVYSTEEEFMLGTGKRIEGVENNKHVFVLRTGKQYKNWDSVWEITNGIRLGEIQDTLIDNKDVKDLG